MDLSKLPKLSQTTRNPDPGAARPGSGGKFCDQCGQPLRQGAKFCDSCGTPLGEWPASVEKGPRGEVGAEAWIGIAMGVLLLFLAPRLILYAISPATFPEKWSFNDAQGNPLPYTKTVFFWGDIALTAFAAVLIVEGIVLVLGGARVLRIASVGFAIITTLFNLGFVIWMMINGYGFQILSGLAVAFGIYICMQQIARLRSGR